MALNFEIWLLLWRNTAACDVLLMSYRQRHGCKCDFIHADTQSDDMLLGCPSFPSSLATLERSLRSDEEGGEVRLKRSRTALLHHAAVRQWLVTVSDKYRGLWSSTLQLYLRQLLGGRERPHHLGAATILIHPR